MSNLAAYLAVVLAAVVVAALTLFSGFGLGTLLLPVFAFFFPIETAVAATAVVHFTNNLFRFFLVGGQADRRISLIFGLTSAVFAILGAWLLTRIATLPPLASYLLAGHRFEVSSIKIVIGLLIIVFSFFELAPRLQAWQLDRRWLPLGGVLSGFFGGLSGHQGALRAAFLAKVGLTPTAFIATNVVCAVLVDIARLLVYGLAVVLGHFSVARHGEVTGLVIAGTLAAFLGSFFGARFMQKVTLHALHLLVGVMLVLIGVALVAGLI